MSDIEFKDSIEFYKDYIKEPVSFLVNSSDNQLRSRENLLQKLTVCKNIKANQQIWAKQSSIWFRYTNWYDLDIQTAKISALSSQ